MDSLVIARNTSDLLSHIAGYNGAQNGCLEVYVVNLDASKYIVQELESDLDIPFSSQGFR